METKTFEWNLDELKELPEWESLSTDDKIALIYADDLRTRQFQGGHTCTVKYWNGKYFCALDGGESAPELVVLEECLFEKTYKEAVEFFLEADGEECYTFYDALMDVGFPYGCDSQED